MIIILWRVLCILYLKINQDIIMNGGQATVKKKTQKEPMLLKTGAIGKKENTTWICQKGQKTQ